MTRANGTERVIGLGVREVALITLAAAFVAISLARNVSMSFPLQRLCERTPTTSSHTGLDGGAAEDSAVADVALPIVPKLASTNSSFGAAASALHEFFDRFPSTAGWIDVNAIPYPAGTDDLRRVAGQIFGRETACGHPKARREIPEKDIFEYCFWTNDFLSGFALKDFSFEREYWTFVLSAFQELYAKQKALAEKEDGQAQNACRAESLGYLDIGINVGDWISPIRLLAPDLPIYGVEGSPGTAALAAANLRTSVEYHRVNGRPTGPSKVLPFSLAAAAQTKSIRKWGGVCFSKPDHYDLGDNIGGRFVQTGMDCPPSDAAGATTLAHALQGLASSSPSAAGGLCPSSKWPRIYIAKMDIEGYEFKAISSAVPWLTQKPPCYMMIEYWDKPSHNALVELFLDSGYDMAWRLRDKEIPPGPAWWNLTRDGHKLHNMLKEVVRGYMEVTVGFSDVDACLARLQAS